MRDAELSWFLGAAHLRRRLPSARTFCGHEARITAGGKPEIARQIAE